jgi:tetratricopeptide (TPR) repeat protein
VAKFKIRRRWAIILGVVLCAFVSFTYVFWQPAWEKTCRRLREKKNWKELARVAERWSRASPHQADPWLFRAEAAHQLNDLSAEVGYLSRMPDGDRRAAATLLGKGRLEEETLNRPWDALRTCDRVLTIDPHSLGAHQYPIYFCAMTLQRRELLRRLRAAIKLRVESPDFYMFLAGASWLIPNGVYQTNSRWLRDDPGNEILQVAQAMHVYRLEVKNRPELAPEFAHIPEPEDLLKRYPDNLELLDYFLDTKINDGDLEGIDEILAVVPEDAAENDPRFLRSRAWILTARGKIDEAEQLLWKGFAIDPYWQSIHYDLSQILRRRGKIQDLQRFLTIHSASRALSMNIIEAQNPNDPKFLQKMLELAKLVDDHDVVTSLQARLSIR